MGEEYQVQVSPEFLKILEFFCGNDGWYTGSDVMRVTGLSAGTVYPMVVRMQRAGWLDRRVESIDPVIEKRLPRRFYHISDIGRKNAEKLPRSEAGMDGNIEGLEPCLA